MDRICVTQEGAPFAYGDDRHMLVISLTAFEEACARWTQASSPKDPATAFAPLAEALWWAVSIDDRMHRLEGDTYRARRDRDVNGRILPAVWWARNRTGHDQALVLVRIDGAEFGVLRFDEARFDVPSELRWRNATELPPGRGDKPFGRDSYERHLQGRPVHSTVEAIRRWFALGVHGHGPLAFGPPTPRRGQGCA